MHHSLSSDLLVAVFYALGDGKGPFLVSVGAIALNAILNWLSVTRYHLGARGLVCYHLYEKDKS